jgi:hypothetical protein
VEVIVTLAVVIIVVLLAVLGFGYLIFRIMRRSQETVPQVTDRDDAKHDLVVGTDEQGRAIHASEDLQEPARDDRSFDALLKDEIRDQGREEPVAPDED